VSLIMDLFISTIFSQTSLFLAWALILVPILVRQSKLKPWETGFLSALTGIAVISVPSFSRAASRDASGWIFMGLCVLALSVAAYFSKRIRYQG